MGCGIPGGNMPPAGGGGIIPEGGIGTNPGPGDMGRIGGSVGYTTVGGC